MNKFLELTTNEQIDIIAEVAKIKETSQVIIEKDFWVCWTLEKISEIPIIADHITFKGGTSLSKVFDLIDRFSEDIDLAFQRKFLGCGDAEEPEKAGSKKKTEKRIADLKEACIKEISGRFVPLLNEAISRELDGRTLNFSIKIDENDPQTIFFYYPQIIIAASDHYVKPAVKIEMGARSDDWPVVDGSISPYIDEVFNSRSNLKPSTIKTLSAERTFWEKATILHAEYHRPESKNTPLRVSRHYYDLHQMHKKKVSQSAIDQIELLARVAQHKSVFFRCGWAKYEEAHPGTLRLVPRKDSIKALGDDYKKMSVMLFGTIPSFDEIMQSVHEMENMVNNIKMS